jgi:hypothetical protein
MRTDLGFLASSSASTGKQREHLLFVDDKRPLAVNTNITFRFTSSPSPLHRLHSLVKGSKKRLLNLSFFSETPVMSVQRMTLVAGRHARRVIRSLPKSTAAVMSTLSSSSSSGQGGDVTSDFSAHRLLAAVAALGGVAAAAATVSYCEGHPHFTPSQVAKEAFPTGEDDDEMQKYPVFSSDQVAENDGSDGKPIWMSVGAPIN